MRLSIQNVWKSYGTVCALKGVSLELDAGVYGLLGPNGAGKSTLIQTITGNIVPQKGEIFYDGKEIHKHEREYKRKLGYVPQSQGIYDAFTAERFLEYMAVLKDMKKGNIHSEVERVLQVVGLTEVRSRKLGGFSGGMRQRVLIAQALIGNPEIVILDEPTAGLDPKERIKIRNFISRIAENKIILIATHVVSDVETIAKEILLLGNGTLVQRGTPEELCSRLEGQVWECVAGAEWFEELENHFIITNLQEIPGESVRVRVIGSEEEAAFFGQYGMTAEKKFANLQEVYLKAFTESR